MKNRKILFDKKILVKSQAKEEDALIMACVHCSESKNHLTKADRYRASAPERRGCDG